MIHIMSKIKVTEPLETATRCRAGNWLIRLDTAVLGTGEYRSLSCGRVFVLYIFILIMLWKPPSHLQSPRGHLSLGHLEGSIGENVNISWIVLLIQVVFSFLSGCQVFQVFLQMFKKCLIITQIIQACYRAKKNPKEENFFIGYLKKKSWFLVWLCLLNKSS